MYSNVILVLCCDRTAKAGLSLGESYGGVSTYHGCVTLSFRKLTSGVFYVIHSKQPCPDSGRFISEFSFSRIRESTTVTHLPLVWVILLPLAQDVMIQKTSSGIQLGLFCFFLDLLLCVAAPTLWNSLLDDVKWADRGMTFWHHLNTHVCCFGLLRQFHPCW